MHHLVVSPKPNAPRTPSSVVATWNDDCIQARHGCQRQGGSRSRQGARAHGCWSLPIHVATHDAQTLRPCVRRIHAPATAAHRDTTKRSGASGSIAKQRGRDPRRSEKYACARSGRADMVSFRAETLSILAPSLGAVPGGHVRRHAAAGRSAWRLDK
jgi:hypothetical protein